MNRIRSLWTSGPRGKLMVLVGGLLGVCVVCSALTTLFPSQRPATTQPGAQPPLTVAVATTPAPTTTNTSAPPSVTATRPATNTPGPTNTPAPSRTPVPPTDTRTPTPTRTVAPTRTPEPTATRGVTEASAPCLSGQIKGNRNSGIYHTPFQSSYRETKANVACFETEEEARDAGFRRADR